jgi:hypothetical protein
MEMEEVEDMAGMEVTTGMTSIKNKVRINI